MDKNTENKIITIPNILSFFRLVLIPVIAWQYCIAKDYIMTAWLLFLSAVTDITDGFIARHFNMSSNLGKALDPVADKLTQFVMLLCLLTRFKLMIIPAVLIFIKELTSAIFGLIVIKKTHKVKGAVWHGKATTVLLYLMIGIHVIWYDITEIWSFILISLCVCMMLISFILYLLRHVRALKNA